MFLFSFFKYLVLGLRVNHSDHLILISIILVDSKSLSCNYYINYLIRLSKKIYTFYDIFYIKIHFNYIYFKTRFGRHPIRMLKYRISLAKHKMIKVASSSRKLDYTLTNLDSNFSTSNIEIVFIQFQKGSSA